VQGQSPRSGGKSPEAESFLAAVSLTERSKLSFLKVLCSVQWSGSGADPRIMENGGPVRGRSPEPSAEGASAGGGSGGLPQKILKN